MGSIANKFASRSLALVVILSLVYLALPVSPGAQGPSEVVILDQELKEATRVLKQQQRQSERAQEQLILQRRLAAQFAVLQVQATTQHAVIEQWRKSHSSEPNSWSSIEASGRIHKNRFR